MAFKERWINHQAWNPPPCYAAKAPIEYLQDMAAFIDEHRYMFDHRSIDFFTCNLWDLVPDDWKAPLLSMNDSESMLFLEGKFIPHNSPSSLRVFVNKAQDLSMPRTPRDLVQNKLLKSHLPPPVNSQQEPPSKLPPKGTFGLPALSLHMTPKKKHEVEHMVTLVSDVASEAGANIVIDVGSGEGYLTQVLCHQLGLPIIAVDERSEFTEGALQREKLISKERDTRQRKGLGEANTGNVTHVVATITLDMPSPDFEKLIGAQNTNQAVLVGLHTCGVLANAMLQLFIKCPSQLAIVDLGCCYYRKSPNCDYKLMSNAGLHTGVQLSPGALKLACDAVHMMASKGEDEYRFSMSSHFYRAVLETVLTRKYPGGHSYHVRAVPRKKSLSFDMYVKEAVHRMFGHTGGDVENQNELVSELHLTYNEYKSQYAQPCVLLLLRAVIAPVIESFILLDRWLYLNENETYAAIIPLFDACISPRNLALVALKTKPK